MAYPTIDLNEKKIILLSGYHEADLDEGEEVSVVALEKLRRQAELHDDAVAFTFVFGKWVPAA